MKAMEGDERAFRIVVENTQDFVYSVAYRFVNNSRDAEDLAQEAFVRLWKNITRYRSDVKLTTWLYKIITNLCLDHLKSRQHRDQMTERDLAETGSLVSLEDADQRLMDEELRGIVVHAASTLTPKQKAVFILRDLEELDVDEVTEILQMSAGNIKSNLFYARKRIAQVLEQYYNDKKYVR